MAKQKRHARDVRTLIPILVALAILFLPGGITGLAGLDIIVGLDNTASINLDLHFQEGLTYIATGTPGLDVVVNNNELQLTATEEFTEGNITVIATDGENISQKKFTINKEAASDVDIAAMNSHVLIDQDLVDRIELIGYGPALIKFTSTVQDFESLFVNDTLYYSESVPDANSDGALLEYIQGQYRVELTEQGFLKLASESSITEMRFDDGSAPIIETSFGTESFSVHVDDGLQVPEGQETVKVLVRLKSPGVNLEGTKEEKLNTLRQDSEQRISAFKSSFVDANQFGVATADSDGIILHEMKSSPMVVIDVTPEGLEKLKQNPNVHGIYENKIYRTTLLSSVPIINSSELLNISLGGNNVNGTGFAACVLDTGLDADHSAFAGRNLTGYDFVNNDTDTDDDNFHGTHVSGIIADSRGVAPGASIVPVKVCNSTGACPGVEIALGLDFCINNVTGFNVTVIVGSIGDDQEENTTTCGTSLDGLYESAKNMSIASVFAAGNEDHENGVANPGCSPFAISVGALDDSDALASFTNRGTAMDLWAPGVSITAPINTGGDGIVSGTSQATPHVAGSILLLQQHFMERDLNLSVDFAVDALNQTGVPVQNWSRISVKEALDFLTKPLYKDINLTANLNTTLDNLTVNVNAYHNNRSVKNITNWLLNGSPISILNMPFEPSGAANGTNDYSGLGNDGTEAGNPIYNLTGGYDGKGTYHFDGTGDYVEIGNDLFEVQEFSVSAWVNPESNTGGIISNTPSPSDGGWFLYADTGADSFSFFVYDGSFQRAQSSTVSLGEWYHLVGVADGSNVKLYVNGELQSTTDTYGTIDYSGTNELRIGYYEAGADRYFDGGIDEFQIFNRSLSVQQVLALYHNRTDLISQNETVVGDIWSVQVTPNDGTLDGITVQSNNVTIVSDTNNAPTIDSATINGTETSDNLSVLLEFTDLDGDAVNNITTWFVDGDPLYDIYMPFDTRDNNTVARDYALGNNGTVANAVFNTTGGFDGRGAYEFDGSGDYIQFEHGLADSAMTTSVWINPQTASGRDFIYHFPNSGGGNEFTLQLNGGTIELGVNDATLTSTGVSVDTNEWTHLSVVYTGASAFVYKNGALVYTRKDVAGLNFNSCDAFLGTDIDSGCTGGKSDYFDGFIDDFRIYNRTLSEDQILAIYQNKSEILGVETLAGEQWSAEVYVMDDEEISSPTITSAVPIVNSNSNISIITLDGAGNLTTSNITSIINVSAARNITTWIRNGTPEMAIYLPMDAQSHTHSTRDFSGRDLFVGIGGAEYQPTAGFDGKGAYNFSSDRARFRHGVEEQVTFAAWVKLTTSSGNDFVMHLPNSGGGNEFAVFIDDNVLEYYINNVEYSSGDSFSDNEWTHIAVAYNQVRARAYINGVEVDNRAVTAGLNFNGCAGYLGLDIDTGCGGGESDFFDGLIDEVMLWNRSLSAQEIVSIYENRTFELVANETVDGDIWSVNVTPHDGEFYGLVVSSNNVTIGMNNIVPTVDSAILNATSVSNFSADNLTAQLSVTDLNNDAVKNITVWLRNGTSTMVVYMPFENTTLGNAQRDYSPFSNNGSMIGALHNQSGPDGFGACIFDGDDMVELGNNASLGIDGPITLMAYIKPTDTSGEEKIIAKQTSNTVGYELYIDDADLVSRVGDEGDATDRELIASSVINTEWQHIAVSWNGTTQRLYRNGLLVANKTTTGSSGSSSETLKLGRRADASSLFFTGQMAEVRIYNGSLSSDQIKLIADNITNVLAHNETVPGDSWVAEVTANDGMQDGPTVQTNSVTILNTLPVVNSAILNATSVLNVTTDNLTLQLGSIDADGTGVKNITNWFLNGTSITTVNMLFEKNGEQNGTKDHSSFGNDGTEFGSIFWNTSTGFDGKGVYEFDGIDDYINLSSIDYSLIGSGISTTIELWVNINTISAGENKVAFQQFFSSGNNILFYFADSPNQIFYNIREAQVGSAVISANEWIHLVGVNNGTHGRFYFNGAQVGSPITYSTLGSPVNTFIGRADTGAYWPGKIDEVRIYNRSLSDAQILALYHNGTNRIVSDETVLGDIWFAKVTPNDGEEDGITVQSNNVTIVPPGNVAPVVTSLILNATSNNNDTTENLTIIATIADENGDGIKNITSWFLNGTQVDVFHLPFENGSSNATFTQGFGSADVNGTVTGATYQPSAGHDGFGAYEFDGSGDRMDISGISFENSFTISLFFNSSLASDDFRYILDAGASPRFIFAWGDNTGGDLGFHDGGTWRNFGLAPDDGHWHHLALTLDEDAGEAKMYVDGIQLGSTQTYSGTDLDASTVMIGDAYTAAGTTIPRGQMDDFIIFNRSLSQAQVAFLAANRSDLISGAETIPGDIWAVRLIPNDGIGNGVGVFSNNVTIVESATAGPNVIDITPTSGQVFEVNSTITIAANVTDADGVENVSANLTAPTLESFLFNLTRIGSTDRFFVNFSDTLTLGRYNITLRANDTLNNVNNTEFTFFISNDSTPPVVTADKPIIGQNFNPDDTVNISANATDVVAVDTVFASILLPSSNVQNLTLVLAGATYSAPYSNTSEAGTYTITYYANDSSENVNSTISRIFNVTQIGTEPNSTLFTSNGTTNFTLEGDLENVDNLQLADENTTVVWNDTQNASNKDLDTFINFGLGFMSVNITGLDQTFNQSTNISFSGLQSCDQFDIFFKDGVPDGADEILLTGAFCNSTSNPSCTNIICANNTMNFTVSHFTGFASGASAEMTIYDQTDSEGGSLGAYPSQDIFFFTNYSNLTGEPITGVNVWCNITFDSDGLSDNMTFNDTTSLYTFNRTFTDNEEDIVWNVTCNGTEDGYTTLTVSDSLSVDNGSSFCDSGDFLSECTITSTKALGTDDDTMFVGNLTIGAGGTLQLTDGTITNLTIIATGNVSVLAGGKIDADQAGLQRVAGTGDRHPRAGRFTSGGAAGGGGSYGGRGGLASRSRFLPTNSFIPNEVGVPGGDGDYCCAADGRGGDGGGLVTIQAQAVQIDGHIDSDGGQGTVSFSGIGSGGSGGAVYINATTVTGTGNITAQGADRISGSGYGGGGGRIAIHYTEYEFTGVINASGGTSSFGDGFGEGTIVLFNAGENSIMVPENGTFNLDENDRSVTGDFTFNNVTIEKGGVLTVSNQTDDVTNYTLRVVDTLLIKPGGRIDIAEKGRRRFEDVPGTGTFGSSEGPGGANGAPSGDGVAQIGDPLFPTNLGGPGTDGDYCCAADGAGGDGAGLLHIYANTVNISGEIRADGEDGADSFSGEGGGAAGGTIYINATLITGDGNITANGGGNSGGNGGSGGRIALEFIESTFTGNVEAIGGINQRPNATIAIRTKIDFPSDGLTSSLGYNLSQFSNRTVNVTHNVYGANETLQIHSSGTPLMEMQLTPVGGLTGANLSSLHINFTAKGVVVNSTGLNNTLENYTVFLNNSNQDLGIFVCPFAKTIDEISAGCTGAVTFGGPFPQNLSVEGRNVFVNLSAGQYRISNINGTGVGFNSLANLTIFDTNDTLGGGLPVEALENLNFSANFTNATSGEFINGTSVFCNLTVDGAGINNQNMTFFSDIPLYITSAQFSVAGDFDWNVTCTAPGIPALFANDSISVAAADTGCPGGGDTWIVNESTLFNESIFCEVVNVTNSATLTFNNRSSFINASNVIVESGATITHRANNDIQLFIVNITAANVTVRGSINGDERGYFDDFGPGSAPSPRGGSYGGIGGSANASFVYGSITAPTDIGSSSADNEGGGLIILNVSEILNVSGELSVTGDDATSAGGAGGGIYIIANLLDGTGTVDASAGGAFSSSQGGGGGGRIAVHYGTDISSLAYDIAGGTGGATGRGASGTLFKRQFGSTEGQLFINNSNVDTLQTVNASYTPILENLHFANLTIANLGMISVEPNDPYNYTNLNWENNGIIRDRGGSNFTLLNDNELSIVGMFIADVHREYEVINVSGTLTHSGPQPVHQYTINLTATNFTIFSGGTITADVQGFDDATGPGVGPGSSGGSYGGIGGDSNVSFVYGSITAPTDLGSGSAANIGGGAIFLNVSNILNVSGTITADGETATSAGGAGGSVYLFTNILAGDGSVGALGGTAASSSEGGAGGGRIAVHYQSDISAIEYGTGGGSSSDTSDRGASGTLFKQHIGATNGQLIINNSDLSQPIGTNLTYTPILEALHFDNLTVAGLAMISIEDEIPYNYTGLHWTDDGRIRDRGGSNFTLLDNDNLDVQGILVADVHRTYGVINVSGTITHSGQQPVQQYLINLTATNMTITPSGSITITEQGFSGGNGPGTPPGSWGGFYGGLGGGAANGSLIYGSLTEPLQLGSGSGNNNGGGAAILRVGILNISGNIVASGETTTSAGGAGGGMLFITQQIIGDGNVSVIGGSAVSSSQGGGSGGRIALYYQNDPQVNFSVRNGDGGSTGDGTAGSLFRCRANASYDCSGDQLGRVHLNTTSVNLITFYDINSSNNISKEIYSLWNDSFLSWNDTASNASTIAFYNVTGMAASTQFQILDNGVAIGASPLTTDSSGVLPEFNVTLSSEHEIIIQEQPPAGLLCNATITTDTTLTEDLQNSTGGTVCENTGLFFGANDITLDCAGFRINSTLSAVNITSRSNVTIKGCILGSKNHSFHIRDALNISIENITHTSGDNMLVGINSSRLQVSNFSGNDVAGTMVELNDTAFAFFINGVFDPTNAPAQGSAFRFIRSHNITVDSIDIQDGGQNSRGLNVVDSINITFKNSNVSGGFCIVLEADNDDPVDVRIYNNSITGCGGDDDETAVTLSGIRIDLVDNLVASSSGQLLDAQQSDGNIHANNFTHGSAGGNDAVAIGGDSINFTNNLIDNGDDDNIEITGSFIRLINNTFINADNDAVESSGQNIELINNTFLRSNILDVRVTSGSGIHNLTTNSQFNMTVLSIDRLVLTDQSTTLYNISNTPVSFINTTFGSVEFLSAVTENGSNIMSDVLIAANFTEITDERPGYDVPANITFLGVTLSAPQILKNDSACAADTCINLSFSGGIFKFNVTGFTNYSLQESPSAAPTINFINPANGASFDNGTAVNITFNVTGTGLDTVSLNITFPNGSTQDFPVTNVSDIWSNFFTSTNESGSYTALAIANDSSAQVSTSSISFTMNAPVVAAPVTTPGGGGSGGISRPIKPIAPIAPIAPVAVAPIGVAVGAEAPAGPPVVAACAVIDDESSLVDFTEADLQYPEGFEPVLDPFRVQCEGGTVDLSMSVPENYKDLQAMRCTPLGCEPVEFYVEVDELICDGVSLSDKLDDRIYKKDPLTPADFDKIASFSKQVSPQDNILTASGYSLEFQIDREIYAGIGSPTWPITRPIHPSMRIIGSPLVITAPDANQITITLPAQLPDDIEPGTLGLFALKGELWHKLPTEPVNGHFKLTMNLQDYMNDGKVVLALIGLVCDNCDDLTFTLQHDGGSRDAIFLVHGFMSKAKTWQYMLSDFKVDEQPYQVWTIEYPATMELDEVTSKVKDHLETKRAEFDSVQLVGHSLGALVIQDVLYEADQENLGFVNKVQSAILVAGPNDGSPGASKFGEFWSGFVNARRLEFFNPTSPMVKDLEVGMQVPQVDDINYYVVAGTEPYVVNLGTEIVRSDDILEIEGENDGIIDVLNAQHVGEQYINQTCIDYFEADITHTDLINNELGRKIIERILTRERHLQGKRASGYTRYFNFQIKGCSPEEYYVIVGKKLSVEEAPGILNCQCGNGVCGVDENVENCPIDCKPAPIESKFAWLDLLWLLLALALMYIISRMLKEHQKPGKPLSKNVHKAKLKHVQMPKVPITLPKLSVDIQTPIVNAAHKADKLGTKAVRAFYNGVEAILHPIDVAAGKIANAVLTGVTNASDTLSDLSEEAGQRMVDVKYRMIQRKVDLLDSVYDRTADASAYLSSSSTKELTKGKKSKVDRLASKELAKSESLLSKIKLPTVKLDLFSRIKAKFKRKTSDDDWANIDDRFDELKDQMKKLRAKKVY